MQALYNKDTRSFTFISTNSQVFDCFAELTQKDFEFAIRVDINNAEIEN